MAGRPPDFLLDALLAETPPAFAPAGEGASACAGCGLAGGPPGDYRRLRATAAALPWAADPARARRTLRALPAGPRARLLAALSALRYLPDPDDPGLAGFFDRRRAVDSPPAVPDRAGPP